MTDALTLLVAVLVPWAAGSAIAYGLLRTRGEQDAGSWTFAIGAGWTLGVVVVTLLLRAVDLARVPITTATAAALTVGLLVPILGGVYLARARVARGLRSVVGACVGRGLAGWPRVVWLALVAWGALHLALLAAEVALRPLFPWEAWTRWATYAKVIAAVHAIPHFVAAPAWLQSSSGVWFDAGPNASATVGLLQAFVTALLGRFDDAAMNVPWVATLAALGSVAYASARHSGAGALIALVVATLVVTLPLPEVHVALAGYPDLFVAGAFSGALVALQAWLARRTAGRLALFVILTLALPYFHAAAAPLAVALALGFVAAASGRRGLVGIGILAGALLLVLLALTRSTFNVLGRSWHLDYDPQFAAVLESWFLLGSWNLLWYGVAAAVLTARRLVLSNEWRPTTTTLAAALAWLACVSAFPALRSLLDNLITVERLSLMIGPALAMTACRLLVAWAQEVPTPLPAEPVAT